MEKGNGNSLLNFVFIQFDSDADKQVDDDAEHLDQNKLPIDLGQEMLIVKVFKVCTQIVVQRLPPWQ